MKQKIFAGICCVLLAGFVDSARAWWSVGGTHTTLTHDALLSATLIGECPDMTAYSTKLESGSNAESHNTSNDSVANDNKLNGGFPKAWWDQGLDNNGNPSNALYYYKHFDFSSAYTYIGRVMHLVQDMTVPAHAANIFHGGINPLAQDNLEWAGSAHREHDPEWPLGAWSVPYLFYQPLQNNTRGLLTSWKEPVVNGRQYWISSAINPTIGEDATAPGQLLGVYGGDGSDIYVYDLDTQDIVRTQLTKTVGYTEGALISASKKLPPLVRGPLQISAPIINTETGNTLTFKIFENRTEYVKVSLLVDGVAIKDAAGNIWNEKIIKYSSRAQNSDAELPYITDFSGETAITWKGEMASGELSDGEHTLTLKVLDTEVSPNQAPDLDINGDGRLDTSVDFTIDSTGPGIKLPGQDFIYGETTRVINLAAGEQKIVLTDDVGLLCKDIVGTCTAVAGIKAYQIIESHTGIAVDGNVFTPPVVDHSFRAELVEGDYVFEAIDALDNKTVIPFKVSNFSLIVSTAESRTSIDRDSGVATGKIHITAHSSIGVSSVTIFSATVSKKFPVAEADSMGVIEADLPFETEIVPYKVLSYGVGFYDKAGRLIWEPLNINFGRHLEYQNTIPWTITEWESPVLDLTEGSSPMLPGAIMSVYSTTIEDMLTKPKWWWESGNGAYAIASYPDPYCTDEDGNCQSESSLPMNWDGRQDFGVLTAKVKTWDDSSETAVTLEPVADRELYAAPTYPTSECNTMAASDYLIYGNGPSACWYTEHAPINRTIPIGRYVKASVTMSKVAPTEAVVCGEITENSTPENTVCKTIYDATPLAVKAGPDIYGYRVHMGGVQNHFGSQTPEGHDLSMMLPEGIGVNFGENTVFSAGMVYFGYGSVDTYPGFRNLAGNLSFNLKTDAKFDHAKLTIPYDPAGLSDSQESGLKIFKILEDGHYIMLGTTVDPAERTVVSEAMDSFGRFFVAAPRYLNPLTVASLAYVGDRPELEFTTEEVVVEQSVFDVNTPAGARLLSSIAEKGSLVGNIYELSPSPLLLETPGTLRLHFDGAAAQAAGLKSAYIYHANSDGTGFYKLSAAKLDAVNQEMAVEVREVGGLYMLVGSTVGVVSDDTPPAVTLSYGQPDFAYDGKVYVSSLTQISLTGLDVVGGDLVSGMGTIYYLIDGEFSLEEGTSYVGPFTLTEGLRTISYRGSDMAGNMSDVSSEKFYVDATSPDVTLWVGGDRYTGWNSNVEENSSITISAVDSAENGAASGVGTIYRLVDLDPAPCFSQFPPDYCETAEYSGPFTLTAGIHTVYYAAVDNVGNMSAIKSAMLRVGDDTTPPVTSISFSEPLYSTGISTYVAGSSSFTLTAFDAFSGVDYTEFSVEADSWTRYSEPFTLAQAYGIPADAGIPEGGIAFWDFDEGGGTTLADSAGTNTGTLLNGPVWSEGIRGGALSFDGSNDAVEVPHSDALNLTTEMTFALWVNRDVVENHTFLLAKQPGPTGSPNYPGNYELRIDSEQIYLDHETGMWSLSYYGSDMVSLPAGEWLHIAVTLVKDGDVTFYLNGENIGTRPQTGAIYANTNSLLIGARRDGYNFDGRIDELAIYDRALSQAEILSLYHGDVSVEEGSHNVLYRSADKAGNIEADKTQAVVVDHTPPSTTILLSGPQLASQTMSFSASAPSTRFAMLSVAAEQPFVFESSTGTYDVGGSTPTYGDDYDVDPSTPAWEPEPLLEPTEPVSSLMTLGVVSLRTLTAPVPSSGGDLGYITSDTELVLDSTDTYSGVKEIQYAIGDVAPFAQYIPPLTVTGADGTYTVRFRGEDNLGWLEKERVATVILDNTAPVSTLTADSGVESEGIIYVSTTTQLSFSANDGEGCGPGGIYYSIDDGPFSAYYMPVSLSGLTEGEHTVRHYSEDQLGNREETVSRTVVVDLSPPVTAVVFSEPKAETAERVYVSTLTAISLAPEDALSGVRSSFFDFDGSGWRSYDAAMTPGNLPGGELPADGIAAWSFDEGGGTSAADSVGSNNGSLLNGPVWVEGVHGSALSFDGADDVVEVPHSDALNLTADMTFSLWFKRDVVEFHTFLLTKQPGPTPSSNYPGNYELRMDEDKIWLEHETGSWSFSSYTSDVVGLPAGQWFHLAVTLVKGGNVSFYLNGENIGTRAQSGEIYTNPNSLLIGGRRDGYTFDGSIDEVAIYNRALAPDEVRRLYEGPAPVSLEDGEHTFSFYSVDKVGNKEAPRSRLLTVDSQSPADIADLSVVSRSSYGVTLAWSVPADAGPAGWVGGYAIAVSTMSTDLSLGNAGYSIEASPDETAGSAKEHTVIGLTGSSTYYAAVWSLDAVGNVSGMSNIVSTRTYIYQASTDAVIGIVSPEVELTATVVSTETAEAAYAVLAEAEEEIELAVPSFYELEPDNITVDPPAQLSFVVAPEAVALGDLAIYRFDGVEWSSVSVYGQEVTILEDGSALVTGYINHTSLYAVLVRKTEPPPGLSVQLTPDTLNLKSNGQYVNAFLEPADGIVPESVRITAIAGAAAGPLYPDLSTVGKKGKYKHVSVVDVNGDGIDELSLKFDRAELQALLPVDEQVGITLEGGLENGSSFTAQAYIRVISPGKSVGKSGGRAAHASGAAVNLPSKALGDAVAITVVKIDAAPEAKGRRLAAAKGHKRLLRGSAYEFGPHGTVFEKPVTLSLPCEGCAGLNPVIAYWNEGSGAWEPLESRLIGSSVIAETGHFSLYQVLVSPPAVGEEEAVQGPSTTTSPLPDEQGQVSVFAGPDSSFRLGEVYVYPNPALRGAAPTLHIETGIADRVEITFYTVSGRHAHKTTLTGMPVTLDDGNGLSYAYEYAWRDSIPSGVYYFSIVAEKGGQKLRKAGKFAVVR